MKRDCNIVICGDLCPTPDTEALFASGDHRGLFGGLCDVFQEADYLVGNLEFALTDLGQGITKCGPVLKGGTSCLSVLKNAGFDLFGLANNHIRDCGDEGVLSTLACCRRGGVATVGAGADAAAAAKPALVEVAGWKLGVIAFAEHEFNLAARERAGAHRFDPYQSFDEIAELRKSCDYLVVLYHGGVEHYRYPSPLLQKKCRKMVSSGADLVLCQHSHCVGTEEKFQGGTILYGQGNTVFGHRPNSGDWNSGLIVRLTLSSGNPAGAAVEYLPIAAGPSGIDLMSPPQSAQFLREFREQSRAIGDPDFVQSSWRSFCAAKKPHYLPLLLGLGRVANYANRKLRNRLVQLLFSRKRLMVTLNLIRCDAHNEVLQTVLHENAPGSD